MQNPRSISRTAAATALVAALPLAMAGADDGAEAYFKTKVQPVLEFSCVGCHGAEKTKGGLRLDRADDAFAGGDTGPAVVRGRLEESLLFERITLPPEHDDIMPAKGRALVTEEVEAFKEWILDGAAWPEGLTLKPSEQDPLKAASQPKPTAKPPAEKPVALDVHPPVIQLETAADHHRPVAVATAADGVTRDVTTTATFVLKNPEIAALEGGLLRPLADGETALVVSYGGLETTVPITAREAAKPRPVSFKLDVMPVFMKAGCNTGSCHGSARGQDGFNLSLFGYDPDGDHHRLTRELSTRRLNLALPEESLMIEKALERVPHSGGKRFEADSVYCRTLIDWLKAGAPRDPADVARPTELEILPRELLLEEGATQPMTVRASYSDGSDRDVTHLAVFQSNNGPSADVSEAGVVTAAKRGEAFVMARFATFTVGSQVIVIPKNLDYTRPELPEANYIDTLVNAKLDKLRIFPSGLCSDEVFLRRATLDITGVLPTPQEYRTFMADSAADKRTALVDELLSRKAFTEMWVMKWAELLQMRTNNNNKVSYKATLRYYGWLRDRIANNVPFNQVVAELLSSTGGTFTNPATNYYQIERDTLKVSENVAQVFMGMRIQCAQCHNHPFDRWTMDDYYAFASFFSQIGRKDAEDPREVIVFNRNGGEVNHPVSKKPLPPKFLGGAQPEIKRGTDRRAILAQWLASPQNPFFARNLANLLWAHFNGAGVIDPVDDVRVSNPASNPQLLDALAEKLTAYDYDFKRLVRDICTSQTYQRSTRPNDSNRGDTQNFAKARVRRLRAEVLLDALSQVTGTPNKFRGLPLGARAVQIADGNVTNYFLTTFGRATRTTVCSCEVVVDPNLSQALHLLNGPTTNARISQGGVVKKLLAEGKSTAEVITDLYLRCFSREPTATELAQLTAEVEKEESPAGRQRVLEDTFWALLNAKEFIFNH